MNNLSTRYGSGSKISVLELVTPKALETGVEYYLNSEGSVIAEHEMLPVVMLPRVGSSITSYLPGGAINPVLHQPGANNAIGSASNAVSHHLRVELGTAPYAMYFHASSSGTSNIRAVVMNERTGERVAEVSYNGQYTASQYLKPDDIAIGWVMTAADKVGLLCNYSTDSGSTYSVRVIEFDFNPGTLALTSSAKSAIGSSVASGYTFISGGYGVSAGKLVIKASSNYYVVNLIGNTINAASGYTSDNCQTEGQYVVTLGATNAVTVANLETNGSASFTATGSSWTGTPSRVVRLHPRVYLILQSLGTANNLRLLTVNSDFTAGVITVVNNPLWAEYEHTTVAVTQQRAGSPVFYLLCKTNDTPLAASLVVQTDGTILSHFKPMLLADSLIQLIRILPVTSTGLRPYVLDVPVVSDLSIIQVNTASADMSAYIWVKYRADVTMGLYKPKYLGRSLGNYSIGASAQLAASPQLLQVEPTQTAFQRTGRIIKVNDLQGFFLEAGSYKLGLTRDDRAVPVPSNPFAVDELGFNYPVVFGSVFPSQGTVELEFPANATAGYAVYAVTPLGVVSTTTSTNVNSAAKVSFWGFLVLGIRMNHGSAVVSTVNLTYDVEVVDYV